jgi:probable H4MPT-linked C1 transfer pathway protein
MTWLGLDIGGANLKIADGRNYAFAAGFRMWQQVASLPEFLKQSLEVAPPSDGLAVTMTGELADCFSNKAEGVRTILDAVTLAAGTRKIQVFLLDGSFASPAEVHSSPRLAASANWLALAIFIGRFAPEGSALLVDIGSTTADLIPLMDGRPKPTGTSDTDRLAAGELIYTGVRRSPICGVVRTLPYRGVACPVAQELFATTRDAYLLLGETVEDVTDCDTADGKPSTRTSAVRRMARMICADEQQFNDDDAMQCARHTMQTQLESLAESVRRVTANWNEPPQTVILSGEGEFLARRLLTYLGWSSNLISLKDQIGEACSQCAPAHAVATLAAEDPKLREL